MKTRTQLAPGGMSRETEVALNPCDSAALDTEGDLLPEGIVTSVDECCHQSLAAVASVTCCVQDDSPCCMWPFPFKRRSKQRYAKVTFDSMAAGASGPC